MPNPAPQDDTWAFGPIGSPFPPDPVKVLNQSNMYVALWYKHGVPVHGRAWSEGGVLQCSFAYKNVELRGVEQLGGEIQGSLPNKDAQVGGTVDQLGGRIQVLQYSGDHNKLGFWYEWIKYNERLHLSESRQLVKCGDSFPILWLDRPEGALLGNLDNKIERATFSHDGIVETVEGGKLDTMWIIVRNTAGGPPTCDCQACMGEHVARTALEHTDSMQAEKSEGVLTDQWIDTKEGEEWPNRRLVMALDKPLQTAPGEDPNQFVALWYKQGQPIMGRAYRKDGKVAASFGWSGEEYKENIGSLQMLSEIAERIRGYDYEWVPYSECCNPGQSAFEPISASDDRNICPCVVTIEEQQILGKVDMERKVASAAFGGKEHLVEGEDVNTQLVLCRKMRRESKNGSASSLESALAANNRHAHKPSNPRFVPSLIMVVAMGLAMQFCQGLLQSGSQAVTAVGSVFKIFLCGFSFVWTQVHSASLTRRVKAHFDEANVLKTYQPRARTLGHLFDPGPPTPAPKVKIFEDENEGEKKQHTDEEKSEFNALRDSHYSNMFEYAMKMQKQFEAEQKAAEELKAQGAGSADAPGIDLDAAAAGAASDSSSSAVELEAASDAAPSAAPEGKPEAPSDAAPGPADAVPANAETVPARDSAPAAAPDAAPEPAVANAAPEPAVPDAMPEPAALDAAAGLPSEAAPAPAIIPEPESTPDAPVAPDAQTGSSESSGVSGGSSSDASVGSSESSGTADEAPNAETAAGQSKKKKKHKHKHKKKKSSRRKKKKKKSNHE